MRNRKKTNPEPNGVAPSASGTEFSLISNEKLLALYTGLLTCRRQGTSNNGTSASICGHEAVLVGATIDLGPGDAVCSREHGVVTGFSHGAIVPTLLLHPGNHPPAAPTNGTMAFQANTNGSSHSPAGLAYTHAAIGTALANKTITNRKVAMVFSRKETSEMLREAVHIATVHALPMVFVHQPETGNGVNGGRSKKKPSELKTPWFPSITVDCHDVVALYRVAFEAISRARLGRGPTLIECRPYRLKNRIHAEDPILHMEHYLRARGLFDPKLMNGGMAGLSAR
jgi:TPP-dependent pyruvate/acetoin dehydrogenase alpha subunit